MTTDAQYMMLQHIIDVSKVLIPFLAIMAVITMFLKLLTRMGLYARVRSSLSDTDQQTLEKSNKIQFMHQATKHELEVRQLKRIMKERDAK